MLGRFGRFLCGYFIASLNIWKRLKGGVGKFRVPCWILGVKHAFLCCSRDLPFVLTEVDWLADA